MMFSFLTLQTRPLTWLAYAQLLPIPSYQGGLFRKLFILLFSLDKFANNLDYNYNYKAVYLISIVSFVGMFYLLSCYLLGILKLKNYKTN